MESSVDGIISTIFSEAFAFWFLLGLLIFLIGLGLCGLSVFVRVVGERRTGKIIGAVEELRIKIKTRDGKEVKEEKRTVYPVFEYKRPDGAICIERGSEGGSSTKKYTTGEKLNLIVIEADGYDDVYDADNYGAMMLGAILLAVGFAIMFQVGSISSAMGVGGFALAGALAFMLFRAFAGRDRNKSPRTDKKPRKYKKEWDRDAVRPVEEFFGG